MVVKYLLLVASNIIKTRPVLITSRGGAGDDAHNGGRRHNGYLPLGPGSRRVSNCVRTGMSISVSISKTCVAANAIYSHKFAGHDALVSTSVATYE